MIQAITKLLAPLRTRIANLVARAVVRLVTDSTGLQVVQLEVLDGETREGCERFQSYGFSSVPLDGAEAVVLFVGGRRDHGLVVAVDDRRHRKKDLEAGEVAIYHHGGSYILLRDDGSIEIETPQLRLGNDTATEFVALANLVLDRLNAIRTAYNSHVHTGVKTGSDSSGPPAASLGTMASVAATKVKAE